MTYVASYFHAFSTMSMSRVPKIHSKFHHSSKDQAETVARRVVKFAELMQSMWISRNDYERRVCQVCALTENESISLTVSDPHPKVSLCT